MADKNHFDKALNLSEIADGIAMVSACILSFRLPNAKKLSQEQALALTALEEKLDSQAAQFRALGIISIEEECRDTQEKIRAATATASEFLKRVMRPERVVYIAVAVQKLGHAILAKEVKAMQTATKEVSALCQFAPS